MTLLQPVAAARNSMIRVTRLFRDVTISRRDYSRR
jgi:hypothetical protein